MGGAWAAPRGGGGVGRVSRIALCGQSGAMFLFFSNRLGCLGSLLVSVAITVVLLLLLGVL